MHCASRMYTFQQLAWQQFIKHFITNTFFGSAETEVSSLSGSQTWYSNVSQRPEATVTSYVAHHGKQWQPSEDRQRRDKEPDNGVQSITSQQTHAWFFSTARSLPSERAPETPLHTKDKQRTFHYITFWLCRCVHNNFTENPRLKNLTRIIDVVLTVREGAAAHSLIKDRHKEHVAVFKIRFHFIDGLYPGKERNTIIN